MTKNGLVFVVDDDSAIRDSFEALGEAENLNVITYSSGEDFLEYISQHADSAQNSCLILDVQMQGISGIDLHNQLRSRNIVLPTIILTGHHDDYDLSEELDSQSVVFLLKPTSPARLLEQIKQMLQGID